MRTPFNLSPTAARVMPFVVVVALTFCQTLPGPHTPFIAYTLKMFIGGVLLWMTWPLVSEMRWKFSWAAAFTGVLVFVMWVGLEGLYPTLGRPARAWDPTAQYGVGTPLAWMLIVVRILGSSLVVPPVEEVFYRSFLYRWIDKPDFLTVPLGRYAAKPFVVSAVVFGFAHHEWLAGILCAVAYQGLICWKKRLGDAMTAHAITNFLLGCWVVWKGAWQFW